MHRHNALIAAVALAAIAHPALADTWDLTADFSVNNGNPNGAWSYGWYTNGFGAFTLDTAQLVGANEGWYGGLGGDGTPTVWRNLTGAYSYGVPPLWVSIHPGPDTQPCCVRWTAPTGAQGECHVSGSFLPGDSGGPTVSVRHNGAAVWSAPNEGAFDVAVQVQPEDTIEFVAYGAYWYGNTPVQATISIGANCPADLDGSGAVDGADLGALLGAWGAAGPGASADFDRSGAVDGADLGVLLGSWGPCD